MAKPRISTEVGKSGYRWYAPGYVADEFLTVLRGTTGIKTYREMRDNDPIIGAFMHAITQILRESRWDVKVPEGGRAEDVAFLTDCMVSMKHSWSDFLSNILTMLTYGWSWFEIVYQRRSDNQIGWKKLAHRAQSSLERWEIDDTGEVVGLWQRPPPDYQLLYLPYRKSLHFRTEPTTPEGRSIMRNAYRSWFFKKNIEEIEGVGLERDLTGLPKITLPEGINLNSEDPEVVAQVVTAKNLVTNIRRDEQDGVIIPAGWELELMSSPGQKQFNTTEIINRYNKQIAVVVLAQFVMLGMERTGSYALAKEQTDMFYLCLEGWMDGISSTINRTAIPKLFAFNGVIDRPLPYIVHTPVRRFTLQDMSNFVARLVKAEALEVDADLKTFLKAYARLSEYSEVRK